MNRPVQIIAIVYLALLVVMCVYVPVDTHYDRQGGSLTFTGGRAFLWDMGSQERLSVGRLLLSIVALTAAGGGAMLVVRLLGSTSGKHVDTVVEDGPYEPESDGKPERANPTAIYNRRED